MLIVPDLPDQLPILAKPNAGVVIACWPRLLTMKMAAIYLGLSVETLKKRERGHQLPGRKTFGKRVVYDRLELDKMIDRNNGHRDLWVDAGCLLK